MEPQECAMFVKINGTWRFAGFGTEARAFKFALEVLEDIKQNIGTEAYRVYRLDASGFDER